MKCSPLQVFFWRLNFFNGNHFTIEGRQKATFWKSELGALREILPKSKMASGGNRFTFEIVHVMRFGNELYEESSLLQIYLYKSSTITRSLGKVWVEILVSNLATNFQDLVTKVKNFVMLVPVLGAIIHPEHCYIALSILWFFFGWDYTTQAVSMEMVIGHVCFAFQSWKY